MVAQLAAPIAAPNLFQPGNSRQRNLRAQGRHLHAPGGDRDIERAIAEGIIGFDLRLVLARGAHQRGRQPRMAAIEYDAGLIERKRRRIRNGDRCVVQRQLTLQAARAGVADGTVHRAIQLQLGRNFQPHMPRQFQQRAQRETIPTDRRRPARLRQVIAGVQPHLERQRRAVHRARFDLQILAGQIQPAAHVERPSLPVRRHQVPAVHIFDVEPAGDADLVDRPGQVQPRRDPPVHAAGLAAQQRRHLAQQRAINLQVQIHPLRRHVPAAPQTEFSQPLRGAIGARRLGRAIENPSATRRSRR